MNTNPPGSPHEGRRAPHAQPTSALRAHTPCWLAMAWSFLELLLHLLHHLHQSCVEAVLLGRLLVGVDELALLLGESKWKASTPAPAQREKKIIRWSGGSFQAEEGGEERVWEVCKWPGRSYLQCLGPLGLPVGMLALVMALDVLSCNVTAAGLLRPSTCTRLQLPSPCPLLLPSRLRPPGTRPRAYPIRSD